MCFLSYDFYFRAKNMNFGVRQSWVEILFTNFAMLGTLSSFERSCFFYITTVKVEINNMLKGLADSRSWVNVNFLFPHVNLLFLPFSFFTSVLSSWSSWSLRIWVTVFNSQNIGWLKYYLEDSPEFYTLRKFKPSLNTLSN